VERHPPESSRAGFRIVVRGTCPAIVGIPLLVLVAVVIGQRVCRRGRRLVVGGALGRQWPRGVDTGEENMRRKRSPIPG
jgi:hypothetical protein